ncbi:hypothetical protein EZV62_011244 [Acer yangbiense]|uniref:Uncharacterized protein n=1 Tax=Acer yangbiense TaxID=1000413 RepID=A0A5C7I4R5_9ROSI|nr:hypothetical protein EZV62_011244 [Acer yangbiense]
MISWPLSAMQFYNEKLVTDVLKIGVGVGAYESSLLSEEKIYIVKRDDFKEAIIKLMAGEEVRLQAEGKLAPGVPRRYTGALNAYSTIVRQEGIGDLWTRIGPNVARNAIINAAELASYDQVKQTILKILGFTDNVVTHLFAGLGAGFFVVCIGSPVDVVKSKMIGDAVYKSTLDCFIKTLKNEGRLAFYKGFLPNFGRLGSWNVIMFLTLEQAKKIVRELQSSGRLPMDSKPSQLQILFLPFLAQGHMIPTVDMARLFARHGVNATVVTTPINAPLFSATIERERQLGLDIGIRVIKFPCEEAGLPEACENMNSVTSPEVELNFFKAVSLLQKPFEQLLEECRPHFLVADIMFLLGFFAVN